VTRTLIDLGAVSEEEALTTALDDAIARGLTSIDHLLGQMEGIGNHGRKGTALLSRLIARRSGAGRVPFNRFERELRRVLVAGGLPDPEAQHEVRVQGRRFFLDFAYPAQRIGIEADGYRFHGTLGSWENDHERRTLLTLGGWKMVHVRWQQLVERPAEIVQRVSLALGQHPLWDI
jgi:very-short-patch-repair endonuclease